MNVTIETKYCISEKDAELLPNTKRGWWLRNITTNEFVQTFKRVECTENVNVTLDLPIGEYKLQCGDWNVKNGYNKSVAQTLYFYIGADGYHACRKFADLPSQSGITITDIQPVTTSTGEVVTKCNTSTPIPTGDIVYVRKMWCTKEGAVKGEAEYCTEYLKDTEVRVIKDENGNVIDCYDGCGICTFGKALCYKVE